jgi:hypothetical protein
MTRTLTTYHLTNMTGDEPVDPRGPNCESPELARACTVAGNNLAIIRTEWRLGGDGDWHQTQMVIVQRIERSAGSNNGSVPTGEV